MGATSRKADPTGEGIRAPKGADPIVGLTASTIREDTGLATPSRNLSAPALGAG